MPKRPNTSTKPAREPGIKTVSFVSLGCPKNLVDSEKMLGLLAEDGIVPISMSASDGSDPAAASFDGADAVVINTCGFLEASKEESLGVIKDAIAAKERGEVRRVVVAGCLVQRHRAKMLEWAPGIDAMVGVFDRDKIVTAVRGATADRAASPLDKPDADVPNYWIAANAIQAAKTRGMDTVGLTVHGKDGKGIGYFEDDSARLRLTPRHFAYLRISEGCNQACAFCTIPSIRGKMRSKPLERIVQEARELAQDGCFELNLIGQDTTSYGDDIGMGMPAAGMPAMLRAVSDTLTKESGAGWVRLMYAYPSNFSDAMIDAFAELCQKGRVIPYIDMPLQHASDAMLTAMRRHVTRAQQERVVERLRQRVPGMAIRTTFISGFPGETEDDHKQLLDFVERSQFDNLGVFEYSKEPGTPAGTMEDDPKLAVPAEVKARRKEEIMLRQQKIVFARNKAIADRFDEHQPSNPSAARVDVLIDRALSTKGRATTGVGKGGRLYQGRTTAQAPSIDGVTYVQSSEKLAPGELVPCIVCGWDGYDLVAKPLAELDKRVGLKILR